MEVEYPAGWRVYDWTLSQYPPYEPPVARLQLSPIPPRGLLALVDERILHLGAKSWSDTEIAIVVNDISPSFQATDQAARTRHITSMLQAVNGRFRIASRSSAAGILDEVTISNGPTSGAPTSTLLLLYPRARPGRRNYEVIVEADAGRGLEGNVREIAIGVISRLQLDPQQ